MKGNVLLLDTFVTRLEVTSGRTPFVIQGTVVSAEHVSKSTEPLNLKRFIREFDIPVIVGGCASYQAGLHLMRTGAVGVLVGVGPGNACTTRGVLGLGVPQATAIADVAGARMRHLDETGVYVHVIADGGMSKGGDIAKAIACGADAVMLGSPFSSAVEAPARGFHWGMATFHPTLPRGARVRTSVRGSLREILLGIDFSLYVNKTTYESWLNLLKGLVMTKEKDGNVWKKNSRGRSARAPGAPVPSNTWPPTRSAAAYATPTRPHRARSTSPSPPTGSANSNPNCSPARS